MTGIQRIIKYFAIGLGVFIIVNIIGAIFMAFGIITSISFDDSGSRKNFSETYNNVQVIDIDVAYSNILVQPGEEFRVDASNVSKRFSSEVSNGKLKIKEKKNWFWGNHSSGKIVISIPEIVQLDDLKIDSGAGKIEVDQVVARQFDVSQGAGLLTIRDSRFSKADIDGGAGMIEVFSSVLNNLDLDAGVGRVSIEASVTGNSKIECGVGEIQLLLSGTKEDYRIQVEKGLGSIKIDQKEYKSDTTFGNGVHSIELDGGVGSIVVDFSVPSTSF